MMQARFERRKIVRSQSLGELLRQTRLERGYRIDEVGKKTMIQPEFVEALEKGRYEDLPAAVYVEGYVKKISRLLQLDAEQVQKIFQKEVGIKNNLEARHKKHDDQKKAAFRNPRLLISPTVIRNAIISLVILFGVGYLWYQVSSLSNPPALTLIQPASDTEVDTDELLVLGDVDATADITINGQAVFVSDQGEFKETVSLQQGSNVIEITATNRLGKTTKKTFQIFSRQQDALAKLEHRGPVASRQTSGAAVKGAETKKTGDLSLEVEIKDLATWVQVEVDGEQEFAGTMLPGSSKNFTAKEYISLTSGKAHKTFVTFNGESLGALSAEGGVIRDLRFDADVDLDNLL